VEESDSRREAVDFQNFKLIGDVAQVPMLNWQGSSGAWYTHSIFLPWELPYFAGGHYNYIFARRRPDGGRTTLYVGETDNFATRMRCHEEWDSAMRLGMNEVHVHLLAFSERRRLIIETDLRHGQLPLLNQQ
jgi:hypothetical protein